MPYKVLAITFKKCDFIIVYTVIYRISNHDELNPCCIWSNPAIIIIIIKSLPIWFLHQLDVSAHIWGRNLIFFFFYLASCVLHHTSISKGFSSSSSSTKMSVYSAVYSFAALLAITSRIYLSFTMPLSTTFSLFPLLHSPMCTVELQSFLEETAQVYWFFCCIQWTYSIGHVFI